MNKNNNIEHKNFFWFYHSYILFLAIYGLVGVLLLKIVSSVLFSVIGIILGVIVFVTSIIALFYFKKLPVVTRVLPIAHFIAYGISLILGIILVILLFQKKDASAISQISKIFIFIFNIFRLSVSSYIIYKFKK